MFGHKPSFGRIPSPDATRSSQTSVKGALTTTVADSARILDVVAGPDDRDRLSLPPPPAPYEAVIETLDVSGLRAAWSVDLGFAPVDADVAVLAEEAASELVRAAGLQLVDRPVRFTDPVKVWLSNTGIDLWLDLEPGMWPDRAGELMGSNRRAFEVTQDDVLPNHARRLVRRQRFETEVAEVFDDVDVLLTPTTAVAAFPAAGPMPSEIGGQPVHPAMAVPFTMLANLCHNPSCSVPAGLTDAGLPVGLQITARRHADDLVLRLARLFEQARPWPRLAPGY